MTWWPPAPGWWLVALGVVVLAWLMYRAARRLRAARRRRLLMRQALRELDAIECRFASDGDAAAALEAVSVLLRRFALTVFDEEGVAGRTGREWVDWLCRNGPRDRGEAALEGLLRGPYQPAPEKPAGPVIRAARLWVRHNSRRLEAPI